jgi:hypothetical protein
MRTKHLWMLLLCQAFTLYLPAQTKTDSVRQKKDRHVILSWSTGLLFIHKNPGELAIGFPYSTSNSTFAAEFNSKLGNPFSQDLVLQDVLHLEFLSRHHSIDFLGGFIPDDDHRGSTYSDAIYFGGGYAHTFAVGKILMIKTGADLLFYQFSRGLGSIDNRNIDVYVLGYDSGPTFNVSYSSRNSTVTKTYTTDRLAVDFTQTVFACTPSVRLSSPTHHLFYWSVQAAWFLPLIDQGGLNLTQLDSAGDRHSYQSRFQLIGLNQPGITAAFNGRPVTRSPYSLGGLYLGATVGICFQPALKYKRSTSGARQSRGN